MINPSITKPITTIQYVLSNDYIVITSLKTIHY